jgi:hypothetical protein
MGVELNVADRTREAFSKGFEEGNRYAVVAAQEKSQLMSAIDNFGSYPFRRAKKAFPIQIRLYIPIILHPYF